MKNKFKLLLISATTILGLLGVGAVSLNSVDNSYQLTTKLANKDSVRVNREAQYDSTINFDKGTGSEYLSNVKVQYAPGALENTASIRFVAAVKADVTSATNVTLPGTYGFHISYVKGGQVQDYMIDVENVYHSVSENVNGVTTYYTNDVSSYASTEGRKSVAEWANADAGYNLFIAAKLENIPAANLDSIVTVQSYLKTDDSTLTSSSYRYVTANNAKEVVSGYYLQANSGLYSMSLSDSKYTASLPLEKGETATLINTYGEEVDNYTSVLAGTYNATYDNENLRLTTREVDVVLEAEDGVYDRRTQGYNGSPCTKAFANDEASGKFGACDMNNCGMGISLMHYSYFAGTYDVQIAYWTGTAGSKSLVSVNGVPQTTAYYNEANGWANNDAYPNITTVSLTFNQGWNSIALSKDGKKDDNPQYGGFVMLDYVKVLGKNTEFDPTEFNVLNPSFKVEAEHAAFETGGKLPQANTNASGGYFVGDYDVVGRYVTFNFYAPLDGQYDIQMGYAKWGNSPSVDVALNDEKVDTIVFDNYANEAWNNFNLNGYKTRVNLSSTELNSVKFTLTNSGVCFDYILLTYVGE